MKQFICSQVLSALYLQLYHWRLNLESIIGIKQIARYEMPKYNSKRNFFIVKKNVIEDSALAYRRRKQKSKTGTFYPN
jgi:hypothetical protein